MTARVIAEEHDEYAEHVANYVSGRVARGVSISDQSLLDHDDVSQFMQMKAWLSRDKVHDDDCWTRSGRSEWPDESRGLKCCDLVRPCLENAAKDQVKRERRRRKVKLELVDPALFSGEASDGSTMRQLPVARSAEDEALETIYGDGDTRLWRAVSELPSDQRAMVELFAELGESKAARALGTPRTTVAYRLKRTLREVREKMDAHLAELPD